MAFIRSNPITENQTAVYYDAFLLGEVMRLHLSLGCAPVLWELLQDH